MRATFTNNPIKLCPRTPWSPLIQWSETRQMNCRCLYGINSSHHDAENEKNLKPLPLVSRLDKKHLFPHRTRGLWKINLKSNLFIFALLWLYKVNLNLASTLLTPCSHCLVLQLTKYWFYTAKKDEINLICQCNASPLTNRVKASFWDRIKREV